MLPFLTLHVHQMKSFTDKDYTCKLKLILWQGKKIHMSYRIENGLGCRTNRMFLVCTVLDLFSQYLWACYSSVQFCSSVSIVLVA